jgi:hypothetical protein
MLTERSKVPSEAKKRYFFPAKNPVDARREVVHGIDREEHCGGTLIADFLTMEKSFSSPKDDT